MKRTKKYHVYIKRIDGSYETFCHIDAINSNIAGLKAIRRLDDSPNWKITKVIECPVD